MKLKDLSIFITIFAIAGSQANAIAQDDNDAQRIIQVDRVVSALELSATQNGTYAVPNSGSNNGGQGWLHYKGGSYSNSISESLTALGFLDAPIPKDPEHAYPGEYSIFDFLVYRCLDRVAVFSKSDNISPDPDHLNWWQENDCSTYPIINLDHTYFSLSLPLQSVILKPSLSDYELVFEDVFDSASLDSEKWNTSLLWGPYHKINNEQQLYVDTLGANANSLHTPFIFTGDTLKITATPISESSPYPDLPDINSDLWHPNSYSEYLQPPCMALLGDDASSCSNVGDSTDFLSGIITSYGSFNMTHGYVEMRAKLPEGQGLWPAFWMLPQHYVKDVPEIDVMEFLGHDVETIYNTYHYFDISDENVWSAVSTDSMTSNSQDWTTDFHTFGMAWSPTELIWYIDGEETNRVSDSEFVIPNQPMHLLANLAVGGNWPGSADETDTSVFPAVFEIDYIRAYKKLLNPTLDLVNDYQLMFGDEFSGDSLNPSKWNTHFLWGPYLPINNEKQYYVDILGSDEGGVSPFRVSGGNLSITARHKDDPLGFTIPESQPEETDPIWSQFKSFHFDKNTPPAFPPISPDEIEYTSGIITSYDAFKFAKGYAEIRAKIPKGDGLWPAFWLLNGYYVGRQPEIDIMEARGENPHEIVHSFHLDNGLESQSYTSTHSDSVNGYSDNFHTYGVRWQPGKIDWYIDGDVKHTYEDEDVAYQVMYVIANLAVGGDFNYSDPDKTLFPISLDIDYIRIYQEKGID